MSGLRLWERVGLGCGAFVMAGVILSAQVKPDNSATNKGDQRAGAVTADQQSNGRSDLQTSQAIRRAIVADKSLSAYAHNVKIITNGGVVTLRGPVASVNEKTMVASMAAKIGGVGKVDNQLEVAKP